MPCNELELSVIIPTYDRSVALEKCLEALSHQTLSKDVFEVIVSDDGSDGTVRDRTEPFLRENFTHSLYLWQSNSGQSVARNHAILKSKGWILLIINDDTIVTPTMLEEHLRVHRLYPKESDAVLGKVTVSPELPYSVFSRMHLDAAYDLWAGQTELDWRAFFTCNISVKKPFLIKFGLFDENLRNLEDVELGERLSHHGLRIIYDSEILGYHYHRLEEEEFFRLAKSYPKALMAWYKKSPHLTKELVHFGFFLAAPLADRIKYFLIALSINRITLPFFINMARYFSRKHEGIAISIYQKIYISLSMKAMKNELRKGT